MKTINPIFLLFASCVILLIAIYSYNETLKQKTIAFDEYIEFESLTSEFITYQKHYMDSKYIINEFETLLKKENIRNGEIVNNNNKIIVKLDNIALPKLDKIFNKIFNQKFNIIKIEMEESKLIIEIGVL